MNQKNLKFLVDEKVKIVEDILVKYADKLPNKFCVYKDGRLRVRK